MLLKLTLELALGKSLSNHVCPMNWVMYSGRGVGGGGGVGGGVGLLGGGGMGLLGGLQSRGIKQEAVSYTHSLSIMGLHFLLRC